MDVSRDVSWSTEGVSAPARVAAWTAALSRQVMRVRAEVAQAPGFRGAFRLRAFGPTAFLRVRSRRQWIVRGPEEIAAGDEAWLFVSTMTRGSGYLHHAGGVETVPRGAVSFVDGDQPFALEFRRDFAYVSALVLRRDLLALLPAAERAHGTVLPLPAGPALGAFLAALEPAIDSGTGIGDENRLYDHFLGLAAAALAPAVTAAAGPAPGPDAALLASIKAHLVATLGEATTPSAVAGRCGVTERKLQRLFRSEGTTLTLWLRRQRLERCARDLADPRQDGRTVTAVAGAWGFDDPTYFSRCFRDAFGITPGAYRRTRGRA